MFAVQYKTLKVLSGRRNHIFKVNIHGIAKIRIRRLCSVVSFVTGKENICFFYERQKHRLSFCYFLVGVSGCKTLKVQLNYHFQRFYFSLIHVF